MELKMRCASPLGDLTVVSRGGAITALVMAGQKYEALHLPAAADFGETPELLAARDWLDAYFAGARPELCSLPLAPEGTAFQQRVWRALLEIPYGETESYGALAKRLHSAPRAGGAAVGRNPVSILIPCHRVLSADGALHGYAGGLERKRFLLTLEGAAFRG